MPAGERDTSVLLDAGGTSPDVAGFLASATVALGRVRDAVNGMKGPQIPWQACHPVPIMPGQISLTAGAGTLDVADLCGPHDPYWWDVRRIGAWGFTAGTVTVYLNDKNGPQLGAFTSPGNLTWAAANLLGPRDRLIFVAASITGTVTIEGRAIEVETAWLPQYLM